MRELLPIPYPLFYIPIHDNEVTSNRVMCHTDTLHVIIIKKNKKNTN